MPHVLSTYLPHDRRHALAQGRSLPEQASGAVLLADLAGLVAADGRYGQRAGSHNDTEAVVQQLNQVLAALIHVAERWHGSVVACAADAMTVWFDSADGPAAPRAASCALEMQRTAVSGGAVLRPFVPSACLKVAVGYGTCRRVVVGEPGLQLFDMLVGAALRRVAGLVRRAQPDEALLDPSAAEALGGVATLERHRGDQDGTPAFALLDIAPLPAQFGAGQPSERLSLELLRPWLPPGLVERARAGLDLFLTELRPAVPLCVRFDQTVPEDDTGACLDAQVRVVQQVVAQYEGTLLRVAPDDQGCTLYAVFGALIAHEDDASRAVLAALDLQTLAAQQEGLVRPRIGISRGVLRMGALGGTTRQTYAALGGAAGLAARLMQRAAPGETLIDTTVQRAVRTTAAADPIAPLRVGGSPIPVPVFAVRSPLRRRPIRLEEPAYGLPLIGRAAELDQIHAALDKVIDGQGQILGIVAAAGMGKSRLVAEAIHIARLRHLIGYGGACQSTGTHSPYLVWRPIWQAYLNIDPAAPPRRQVRALERTVSALVPDHEEALPLLGPLLGLSIPDTSFTAALEPKDRRGALHHLLRACLIAAAREAAEIGSGLLLVLEDMHWIDAASHALLLDLAEAVSDLPVLIVLTARTSEYGDQIASPLTALQHYHSIHLDGLDPAGTEALVQAKLARFFPARASGLPADLLAAIALRTHGCPFYIEELLNYLHDCAIDPRDQAALAALDWPDSLHSLILSRLDRLSSSQQAMLKAASVIGRRFPVAWLEGVSAHLLPTTDLRAELSALVSTDLIILDTAEPEPAYLFKHVVTQEVSYASLGEDVRALVHGAVGDFLETLAGAAPERYLDALAHHYDRSNNLAKRRRYLRQAAEVAMARFANTAALSYIERALALAPADDWLERCDLLILRAQACGVLGRMEEQAADLDLLDTLLASHEDHGRAAVAALLRAEAATRTGRGPAAVRATQLGIAAARRFEAGPQDEIRFPASAVATMRALWYQALSWLLFWMGQQGQHDAGLALARDQHDYALRTGNRQLLAHVSYGMLALAIHRQQYLQARQLFHQTLERFRSLGDRRGEAQTLAYIGTPPAVLLEEGELRAVNARALELYRPFDDHWGEAWVLANSAAELLYRGDGAAGRQMLEQSIARMRQVGDLYAVSDLTAVLGGVFHQAGLYDQAHSAYTQALTLALSMDHVWLEIRPHGYLASLYAELESHEEALLHARQALELARSIGVSEEQGRVLLVLGGFYTRCGELEEAGRAYRAALECYHAMEPVALVVVWRAEARAGLAQLALLAGRTAEALAHVQEVLPLLRPWGLSRANEPFRTASICVEVLEAAGDPRAPGLRSAIAAELQRRAALLWDDAARDGLLKRAGRFCAWRAEV